MNELTVVIQAGGESRRMGKPKALVSFCGMPLVCRGLKRLGTIASQLVVTSNDQSSLDFLCSTVTMDRLELYSDLFEGRGALNGVHTALHYARYPFVAIVACDMIFPSAPLLLAERDALVASGGDLAVPRTHHGYEPFHAVYRRDTCLPLVHEALLAGETRATGWFDKARLVEFDTQRVLRADPRGGAFVNVNTPEELQRIEKRVLNGDMPKLDEEWEPAAAAAAACPCGYRMP